MPRCARVKNNDCVYHIMVRSISDTDLFRDMADKEKYLDLVQKYENIFLFKIYAYCLMDTHAHFIIDAAGEDISKIMHGINQSYAQYFNSRHKRRGHLFMDRFKSKIVDDERYLVTLSGYIHNNPSDMDEYAGRVEDYMYSSLGIYLGKVRDSRHIVDADFIMQFFSRNRKYAREKYIDMVRRCTKDTLKGGVEFSDEHAEYRSERRIIVREHTPKEVIGFVAGYTRKDSCGINIKYSWGVSEVKALTALLLRGVCDMKQKDICAVLGNITQSHASRLCNMGLKLTRENKKYRNIVRDFIGRKAA